MLHPRSSPTRDGLRLRHVERAGPPPTAPVTDEECAGTGGGKPPALARRVRGKPGRGNIGGTSASWYGVEEPDVPDVGEARAPPHRGPSLTPRRSLLSRRLPEVYPERGLRLLKEARLPVLDIGFGLSGSSSGHVGV